MKTNFVESFPNKNSQIFSIKGSLIIEPDEIKEYGRSRDDEEAKDYHYQREAAAQSMHYKQGIKKQNEI